MNKKDFSISDLFAIFRKRWWIILLCGAVLASLVGVYSVRTYKPTYRAVTTFYIRPNDDGAKSVENDVTNINYAMKVINSYITFLRTNNFAQQLSEKYAELFLDGETTPEDYKTVKSMITATPIDSTNIFKLSIESDSPETALNYARAAEVLTPAFIDVIAGEGKTVTQPAEPSEPVDPNAPADTAAVTEAAPEPSFDVRIADPAVLPRSPINGDNLTRNVLIAFAAGAVITYLIFFFVDLFDVRIKGEEDLINNYTLPIIGTVPSFEASSGRKKGYKYGN